MGLKAETAPHLFDRTIDGKDSWTGLFQSGSAFEGLVKEIFKRNNFDFSELQNLTPGTNAVFRIDDKVIKIFAPVESGFYDRDYYTIETEAQKHANNTQITAPRILAAGIIRDKYIFPYIIMEFINGHEAEFKFSSYSEDQKMDFAYQIKRITEKLNIEVNIPIPVFAETDYLENTTWTDFPASFCEERKNFIKELSFEKTVYVHGDITAENVIIDDDDVVYLIDFADSRIAPPCYEWPPLIFSLFGCDPIMMKVYFGDYNKSIFYEQLTISVLIHEFGASFVKQLCVLSNISIETISNIKHLRAFLKECLDKGNTRIK